MLENEDKIVSSKKYLDWLSDFTSAMPNKAWDDESISYKKRMLTSEDERYSMLLPCFQRHVEKLAREQYVLSLPCNRIESMKYHIKLRNKYYETSLLTGNGIISVIKEIEHPNESFVYIDEKMPINERKERELIQYVLLNKDIQLEESVYSVHIAHACTIAAMKEQRTEKFDIWYGDGDKQKIVILDAPQELMEKIENKFYGIRDTGHRDIPKNSLIALSLGILSKKEAKCYTELCSLHK